MPGTLALFDLDHTLVPFDSGMQWTKFLVGRGRLPAGAEARYLDFCFQYAAGTLDIHQMHASSFSHLAACDWPTLQDWAREFEAEIAPRIPASRRALVQRHLQAGHLCAIVTATTRLIAQPLARLFGVQHLLATDAVLHAGRPTGAIEGLPCFRAHKLEHVQAWLARLGHAEGLAGFEHSVFYSDSISDLPLLQAVAKPVAVCPDARLREHAQAAGWAVWCEDFQG